MRGPIVFLTAALKAALKYMKPQHLSKENKLIHSSLTKELPAVTFLMKIWPHFPNLPDFSKMINVKHLLEACSSEEFLGDFC